MKDERQAVYVLLDVTEREVMAVTPYIDDIINNLRAMELGMGISFYVSADDWSIDRDDLTLDDIEDYLELDTDMCVQTNKFLFTISMWYI